MLGFQGNRPSAAKAELLQSTYVRPKGRTLQKTEFFRSWEKMQRIEVSSVTVTVSGP